MDLTDLQDAIKTVRYKHNSTFEVFEIDPIQGPYLLMLFWVDDSNAPEPGNGTQLRIASPIPPMDNYEQFYKWLAWRIAQAELHEVLEWYRVDGKHWINPHAPI